MGARSQIQANEGVAKEQLLQREVMLNMCLTLHEQCFFPTETEGFKIDTMGTYHGLSMESVKVVCNKINLLSRQEYWSIKFY